MDQTTSDGRRGWIVVLVVVALAIAAATGGIWYLGRGSGGGGGQSGAVAPKAELPLRAPGVVYEADMNGSGDEWSSWRISDTPNGQQFIGPFGEDPVEFNLDRLPAHQFVRVRFELITYTRWCGDNAFFGRDSWDMRVADGQPLIHTTFSNCGFFSDNNQQSFPDQFPWYPQHKGWTGISAKQSLGWMTPVGSGAPVGCDSTYAFDLTFPHEGHLLALQFMSDIARNEKKPYGFLSFKVETVDKAAPGDDATLAALWEQLADEDSAVAYKAVWSMVATGDAATDFIRRKLVAEMTGPSTGVMIRPGFEWAAAMDYSVKPPKRVQPKQTPGPGVLNVDPSADWIAESIAYRSPEQRQRARAVHVLEAIGTAGAMEELKLIGYAGTPLEFPPDESGFTTQRPQHVN